MPTRDPPPDWVLPRRREIGLRIAARREALGLAVDDIAESTGLNRKTVMAAEQAINATTIDVLLRIAHALDIPLSQLVEESPPQ